MLCQDFHNMCVHVKDAYIYTDERFTFTVYSYYNVILPFMC